MRALVISPTLKTVPELCPNPTTSEFQARAHQEPPRIIKGKTLPAAKDVAEYGHAALLKKRVAAYGFRNLLMAQQLRPSPRRVVTKAGKHMMTAS